MEMTGEQTILAPREKVWQALNDPDILRQSIPGCETVDKLSETEYTALVTAKVGPVKAKFKGKVTLSDLDPPNGYTIQGEGTGGAAGFGKGGARVVLEDVPEGTLLRYTANASVGGKLAQIGSRLVDGAARKMADDFFVRFNRIVSEGAAADTAAMPAGETEAAEPEARAAERGPSAADGDMEAVAGAAAKADQPHPIAPTVPPAVSPMRGLPPWIWIGGLVALAILVLALYSARG